MNFRLLYPCGTLLFALGLAEIDAIEQFDVISIASPTLNLGPGCLTYFPKYYTNPISPAQFIFMEGKYPSGAEIENVMYELGDEADDFKKVEELVDKGDTSVKDMRKILLSQIKAYSPCRRDNNSVLIENGDEETVITFKYTTGCEDFADLLYQLRITCRKSKDESEDESDE